MADDVGWAGARRIEEWAGETRVNLFRLAALLAFYAQHLYNVYFGDDPSVAGAFHLGVTALVLAWSGEVVALYLCLARRWLPPLAEVRSHGRGHRARDGLADGGGADRP
jgi:hypothetical protein